MGGCALHVCLTHWLSRVVQALQSIMSDGRLLMMVLVQALFEGSMLVFIVVWVPALKAPSVSCFSRVGSSFVPFTVGTAVCVCVASV